MIRLFYVARPSEPPFQHASVHAGGWLSSSLGGLLSGVSMCAFDLDRIVHSPSKRTKCLQTSGARVPQAAALARSCVYSDPLRKKQIHFILALHMLKKRLCLQGWYALFPLSAETTNANIIGWTALVGGTLFEVGAYCMVVEAVNRGNTVRFGYEVCKAQHSPVWLQSPSDAQYLGCIEQLQQ